MANTSNNDWDVAAPAGGDPRKNGDDEIRYLRGGVGARLAKEHTAPAAAGVGGEHSAGSAKGYYGTTDPTVRPDAVTALSAGDAGRLSYRSDTGTLKVWSGAAWVATSTGAAFAHLSESQVANTPGGTFTTGAWRTRTLNTEVDGSSIVTLAANTFTLAAGTYYIKARCPAMRVNSHQARLRNTSDNTTPLAGSCEYSANSGSYASNDSIIEGIFTITGAKNFQIQHQCESTSPTTAGLGQNCNFGELNIFTQVLIVKIG